MKLPQNIPLARRSWISRGPTVACIAKMTVAKDSNNLKINFFFYVLVYRIAIVVRFSVELCICYCINVIKVVKNYYSCIYLFFFLKQYIFFLRSCKSSQTTKEFLQVNKFLFLFFE